MVFNRVEGHDGSRRRESVWDFLKDSKARDGAKVVSYALSNCSNAHANLIFL